VRPIRLREHAAPARKTAQPTEPPSLFHTVRGADRIQITVLALSRLSNTDAIIAATCAALATLTGMLTILASQDGSLHPSALVKISDQDPLASLARGADPHFRLVTLVQHYDGAYYYAIARDPFLHGKAHTLIDQNAYRYGHPLHGWLAGFLSFSHARAIPLALMLLSLVGLAVGGWATSRLAVHFHRTAWSGLLIAFSPGLLYATTVCTTETLGVALIALTFLAWVRGRYGLAALLIVAGCLDKEQYVTVPLGLAVWEIVDAWRHRARPERLATKAVAVIGGPVVLSAWYLYVHSQLHAWSWTYQSGNFGKPFAGWRETFQLAHALSGGAFEQSEIAAITPPILAVVAVVMTLATVVALRIRTPFDAAFLGMAIITSMQGWRTLLYPRELIRTPTVALLLAVAVLFAQPRGSRPSSSMMGERDIDASVKQVSDAGSNEPQAGDRTVRQHCESAPIRP
jgi:hypothetical protein